MPVLSTASARILDSRVMRALLVALAACAVLASTNVWADKGDLQSMEMSDDLSAPFYVPLGKADLITVEGDVADVMVANPSIIDVTAVQSNKLYVVGMEVGDTNLIALDASGNVLKKIDVHVKYDLKAIQALVHDLFPDESIKVGSIHDQILLTGKVSTSEVASKAANIVGHYVSDLQEKDKPADELVSNLLEVLGGQQVMLQVKIVEAQRSVIRELSVDTDANDDDELSATEIFGETPSGSETNNNESALFRTGAGIALSQDPTGLLRFLGDTNIAGIGRIGLFLAALEEENLVNILAEPNLTAVSGEQAGFLAGGEFPVPVGRDQVGNLVIEFREFGVSLNFRPVVMSENRISMQLNTEVSSLDFESGIVLSDTTVPGLDIRKADTTVEIPSGGTLMIAGLLQSKAVKGLAGLPGVSKAPILGDLVKSDQFQRNETELVVFVTPYLATPYAEKQRAEQIPEHQSGPLAQAFAINIRRAFEVEDESIFAQDGRYGYILE